MHFLKKTRRKCLYRNCDHNDLHKKCTFHTFPKSTVLSQRWLDLCGISFLTPKRITPSKFICSCHFKGGGRSKENQLPVEYVETVDDQEMDFAEDDDHSSTSSQSSSSKAKRRRVEDATPTTRDAAETLCTMVQNVGNTSALNVVKQARYTPKRILWTLRAANIRNMKKKKLNDLLEHASILDAGDTQRSDYSQVASMQTGLNTERETEDDQGLKRTSTMLSGASAKSTDLFRTESECSIASTIDIAKEDGTSAGKRSIGIQCKRSFLCYDVCKLLPEAEFQFYTGVTQNTFEALYKFLGSDLVCDRLKYQYCRTTPRKYHYSGDMTSKDKLLMTLIRLRRGIPLRDLAVLFQISKQWASKCVYTWVRFLSISFSKLDKFMLPTAAKQEKDKPNCFSKFKNLRVIIDSTEFKIQKPKHFQQQSNTHSTYKAANTIKFLVGISCYVGLSFLSEGFEGSISDRKLLLKSGLLDMLQEGDVVMADRGFDVEDLLNDIGVDLIIPSFLGQRDAFTGRELVGSKLISAARIHVESFIGKIKEFRLVRYVIPNSMLPVAADLVKVCAYLVNFQVPFVKWK